MATPPTLEAGRLTRKAMEALRAGGIPALARAANGFVSGRYREWRDASLDRRFGIETCGMMDISALGVAECDLAHSHHYEPVQIAVFRDIMRAAAIEPGEYDFVDFGSGKGRAL